MKETAIEKPVNTDDKKVVRTKFLLLVFALAVLIYYIFLGFKGEVPPDYFFTNFVLVLTVIGGVFIVGNVVEHKKRTAQIKAQVKAFVISRIKKAIK